MRSLHRPSRAATGRNDRPAQWHWPRSEPAAHGWQFVLDRRFLKHTAVSKPAWSAAKLCGWIRSVTMRPSLQSKDRPRPVSMSDPDACRGDAARDTAASPVGNASHPRPVSQLGGHPVAILVTKTPGGPSQTALTGTWRYCPTMIFPR
jgi:hypothetical protein